MLRNITLLPSITSLIQSSILSKIQIFWDVMLHHWINSFRHSEGLEYLYLHSSAVPEDLHLNNTTLSTSDLALTLSSSILSISADIRVLYLLLAYFNSTWFCAPKTSNMYANTDGHPLLCRTVLSFILLSRMKKSFNSSVSLMKQFKTFFHDNTLVLMLKIRFWIQISSYHIIFKTRVYSVACLLYNLPFLLCHLTLQKALIRFAICFSARVTRPQKTHPLNEHHQYTYWHTGFSWQICGSSQRHTSIECIPTLCCFIQLFTTQKFPVISHHDLKKLSKVLRQCQCQATHLLTRHRVFYYAGFQVSGAQFRPLIFLDVIQHRLVISFPWRWNW